MTKNKTTVTFDDGTVASRTSVSRTYTHAVAVSAEIPELVRPHLTAGIESDEQYLSTLAAALEKMEIVIRHRGFSTKGKDLGFTGEPSWSNYEAALVGTRSDENGQYGISIYCNSEGICSTYISGGATRLEPAQDVLKRYAEDRYKRVAESLASKKEQLIELDAGTYDTGKPKVLRWSSREDLAVRAMNSEFGPYHPTRRIFVTAVDN